MVTRHGRSGRRPAARVRVVPCVCAAVPGALVLGLLAGCTADASGERGSDPTSAPVTSAAGAPTDAEDAGAVELTQELRRLLTLPPLPSFTVPTDLLSDASRAVTEDLDVPPGLYEGIAVLDARCSETGDVAAADAGASVTGTASYDDGTSRITVAGDGTGVYDTPDLHVAVLADGSGVYDDGQTRVSVAADGSGTYESEDVRYAVQPDGSGSYDDGTTRLWVDAAGGGGYDDGQLRMSWDPAGGVFGDADDAQVAAVQAVLAEGLPRFPPVPRIARVEPGGTVCGTVIRLDANVLFELDSAEIGPEGAASVQRVAALLVALGSPRALVEGHTDHLGGEAYNLDLSQRRAEAVRALLVGADVPDDALEVRGAGEAEPLQPGTHADGSDDPAARQLNRRVEIVLLDGEG